MSTLIEDLAEMLMLTYISDLPRHADTSELFRCVEALPSGMYPLSDWTAAVRYIRRDASLTFETEQEARAYITQPKKITAKMRRFSK